MTDDELTALFENWSRYIRNSFYEPSMCQSIESRYRSPQTWHPPEARPPEVDRISGMNVEKQVTYLRLSENKSFNSYAEMLKGHHVYKAKPEVTCRKARIRIRDYNAVLRIAQLTVKNRMKS